MFLKLNAVFPFATVLLLSCKLSTGCQWNKLQYLGCSYYQFSSKDWCTAYTYYFPRFSFYFQPFPGLQGIAIRLSRRYATQNDRYSFIDIPMEFIHNSYKWYHIQFQRTKRTDQQSAYQIVIDNNLQPIAWRDAHASRFEIIFIGSLSLSTNCIPSDNKPQSTWRPIQPVVPTEDNGRNRPVTPETELTPNSPGNMVDETTENGSLSTLSMVDSNTSTLDDSALIFGEPWWVTAVTGLSFLIVIVCIIIVAVICKKLVAMSKEESRMKENKRGINNRTFSDSEWEYRSYSSPQETRSQDGPTSTPRQPYGNGYNGTASPHRTQASPNRQRNEYGKELTNNDTETIYENIRIPNARVHVNKGNFATQYGAANESCTIYSNNNTTGHVNRGSSHDSENSLYGVIR